jgi:hypothetical protein
MAVVTGGRTVAIPVDALVIRIRLRLVAVRTRMANDARKHKVVRRIDVAVGAYRPMVWLSEPRVVENRAQPIGRDPSGVAGHAGGRVLRGDVVRHTPAKRLCALPSRLVAAVAIGVRGCQGVIAADVARSTRRGHVETLQRPACRGVVKLSIHPEQSVMTGGTKRSREARLDVIRDVSTKRRRTLPRGYVAAVAVGIGRRKRVVVAHVAIRAGHYFSGRRQLVRTRKRPPRRGMVKNRRVPTDGVMAGRAVCSREWCSGCRVGRIVRLLPGCQMALGIAAVRRRDRQAVVVVDVARSAGGHLASVGH